MPTTLLPLSTSPSKTRQARDTCGARVSPFIYVRMRRALALLPGRVPQRRQGIKAISPRHNAVDARVRIYRRTAVLWSGSYVQGHQWPRWPAYFTASPGNAPDMFVVKHVPRPSLCVCFVLKTARVPYVPRARTPQTATQRRARSMDTVWRSAHPAPAARPIALFN